MEYIATTANNIRICVDPVRSHAATHLADTPNLRQLVHDTLTSTVIDDNRLLFETVFDSIIGTTDLVANDPDDEIVYAKRLNRDTYTSFNKSQAPQPCRIVTIALTKLDDSNYELASAWIGTSDSPPFPGDENETEESKPYWTTHSLVWGTQAVQPGTITMQCPW
jgi:hypothetical protein